MVTMSPTEHRKLAMTRHKDNCFASRRKPTLHAAGIDTRARKPNGLAESRTSTLKRNGMLGLCLRCNFSLENALHQAKAEWKL